ADVGRARAAHEPRLGVREEACARSRTGRGPREEGPRARPELALRARHPPAADRIRPADRGAVGATRVGWDVSYPVWHGGRFTPTDGHLAHTTFCRHVT